MGWHQVRWIKWVTDLHQAVILQEVLCCLGRMIRGIFMQKEPSAVFTKSCPHTLKSPWISFLAPVHTIHSTRILCASHPVYQNGDHHHLHLNFCKQNSLGLTDFVLQSMLWHCVSGSYWNRKDLLAPLIMVFKKCGLVSQVWMIYSQIVTLWSFCLSVKMWRTNSQRSSFFQNLYEESEDLFPSQWAVDPP